MGDCFQARRFAPEELLTRLHQAQGEFYAGGSVGELRSILTEDVRWTVPGASAIAGEYVGFEAVIAYFAKRREIAAATFRMNPRELLTGSGEHVAALTDGTAVIDGADVSWSTVGLYRLRGERIAACWLLPLDPAAFDRIWDGRSE